jgi:uncharacterized damage-inducible protein DinB
MQIADIRLLFDHLYWMRDRILASAREADHALVDPAPVTIRDLRSTLVHEIDVEWSWRERLDRPAPPRDFGPEEDLDPVDFPTVEAIAVRWGEEEAAMRAWFDRLTDADLGTPWVLESRGGLPLEYHLLHLYTHALQQLSDAATLLTRAGWSPGELDFLEFVRTRQ